MMPFKTLLWLVLLCLSAAPWAEIYRWQDAAGNTHFSDRPTMTAEVKIVPIAPSTNLYAVKRVYDGDTIELDDGRKIRFLGMNTPEISHRGKSEDMGGKAAKAWLSDKLKTSRVRLEFDAEQTDSYGRTLAYVLTENRENLNVQLVAQGLAAMSIFPPNLRYVNELTAAQAQAEQANLGIWQMPQYAVIAASEVSADENYQGWTRVVGSVRSIKNTKKYSYLVFTNHFSARIDHDNTGLFPSLENYQGRTLEVRGWLNKGADGVTMLIRHPSAIKLR